MFRQWVSQRNLQRPVKLVWVYLCHIKVVSESRTARQRTIRGIHNGHNNENTFSFKLVISYVLLLLEKATPRYS